jgi:phage gp29-like protein
MSDYIMGEILTTGTASTGLGSGVASAHEGSAEQRITYDCIDLDSTMQTLVNTLNRFNCPNNPAPFFRHIVDKPDAAEVMEAVDFYVNLGGSVGANFLQDMLGIPDPEPGEQILTKIGALQPAAVNMNPQETPVVGQPGPTAQVGSDQDQSQQDQTDQQSTPDQVQQPVQQSRQLSFSERYPKAAYRLARKRNLNGFTPLRKR